MMRDFFLKSAQQFRLPLHGGTILCPDQSVGQAIATRMSHLGTKAEFVSDKKIDINAPYIKVLTLHSAKGLEFPFVTVVGLREGRFPQIATDLPTEEVPEVLKQQRRLFYVGCSRATRALMVCGSQAKPSPFLDTLRSPYWQTQDSL